MKKLGVIFIEVIINVFPTNFDIGVKNSIFFFKLVLQILQTGFLA